MSKRVPVGVRVNVDNSDGRLKPGMLVRAVVRSQTAANGSLANASLAGKWIESNASGDCKGTARHVRRVRYGARAR